MLRIADATRTTRRWVLLATALGSVAACGDQTALTPNSDVAFARTSRANNSISLTVNGVASGAASIRVTGPNSYSRDVTGTMTLSSLLSGTYTVSSSSVNVAGVTYAPTPASKSVSISGGSRGRVSVSYAANTTTTPPTTGAFTVTVTMPDATPAAVTVTGPNGFSSSLSGSQTLSSLPAGTYTVTAAGVTSSGGTAYAPTPATQTAVVTAGATATAGVLYAATVIAPPPPPPPSSGLNLTIGGMYITQSVQSFADTVPLVAGRDGMLRIFALANLSNTAQPVVRARVYKSGALVATLTANPATSSVPLAVDESALAMSWNIAIPGSLISGGLSILAEVDPSNTIGESSETDNQFPSSGVAKAFNVRAVPNFAVKFVPVYQDTTYKGNVSTANTDAFLTAARDMHPLSTVTSSVRVPLTTNYRLAADGTNWTSVLSEVRAAQVADGSKDLYYGVVKVPYSSGVAGMGYIGAPASIGWDYLPSGSWVMAHEIGHNWGRQHAPCGGVAGADAAFPYAGGLDGSYGFNVRTGTLYSKSTPDLMGYCQPSWISDYTYLGVLKYRGSTVAAMVASAAKQPSLLVWGRVNEDGTVVLEPSVRLDAEPSMPARGGAYSVRGTDANGVSVFSLSFDPTQVATETGRTEGHFAFIVPLSDAAQNRLTSISARGKGQLVLNESQATPQALATTADNITIDGAGTGRARARWNVGTARMVVVRDASTGQVLSFARDGDATLRTSSPNLEVIVSDGVRSTSRRVTVRNFR